MRSRLRVVSFCLIAFRAAYAQPPTDAGSSAVAPQPVRSAKELAGKWLYSQKTPDFSGDLTLRLRTDGTFLLMLKGMRDNQPVAKVERGTWRWTGSGSVVQLSGRARALDLGQFERVISFVSTGSAAILYLSTLAISAFLSLWFLRRYRERVRRLAGVEELPVAAPKEVYRSTEPALVPISDIPVTPGYEAMRKKRFKMLAAYGLAGMCQALLATLFWISNGGLPMHAVLFLTLLTVHAWPVLVAHLILLRSDFRVRAVLVAAYLALLGSIAVGAGFKPLVTNGVRLSATAQVYFLWAGLMLVPTLGVWILLRRRVRAAGPLTFGLCLFPMVGAWMGLVLMDQDYVFAHEVLFSYVDSVPVFLAVLLAAAVACLPVGWFGGRFIGRLYGRKILNDQTITIDALWLNFCLVESVSFSLDRGVFLGVGEALLLFAVYRVVLTLALRFTMGGAERSENRRLLLLRVFRRDRGADQLMEVVGSRWAYAGSIQLIGGTDLATSTVHPNQFLDFVRRRLDSHFVKTSEDLDRRLCELDFAADPDGRYRVNEILCQGEVWREAVQRLTERTDAVLMDLRGFHEHNEGCRHELRVLFESLPLQKVVLVTDTSTKEDHLRNAVREAWQSGVPGGPNSFVDGSIRTFAVRSIDVATGLSICKALQGAELL